MHAVRPSALLSLLALLVAPRPATAADADASRNALAALRHADPAMTEQLLLSAVRLRMEGYPLLVPEACVTALESLPGGAEPWPAAAVATAVAACPGPPGPVPPGLADVAALAPADEVRLVRGLAGYLREATGPAPESVRDHDAAVPLLVAGVVGRHRAAAEDWPPSSAVVGPPQLALGALDRAVEGCLAAEAAFPGADPATFGTRAEVLACTDAQGQVRSTTLVRADGRAAGACLREALEPVPPAAGYPACHALALVTWIRR